MTLKPLVVELFCGTFGWSDGFLAEGYRSIGFDIEHLPHHGPIPDGAELVLQDVLTLHGSQFKDAAVIVASSPCQEFSYRHMPWKRARALPPPELGMKLFAAAFRIQREAIEAAGRFIPLVAENVVGAQKWVGRAAWHYGSYYLWGDVPALMPNRFTSRDCGVEAKSSKSAGGWFNDYKTEKCVGISRTGSKSPARKAASAQIAKIPFELSRHIAATYYPRKSDANS